MCVFCKIVSRKIPAEIIFEDKKLIAFKDANPLAKVHVLIIPKKHITSFNDFEDSDKNLIGEMLLRSKKIAQNLKISQKGYKLLIRTGEHGGQEVPHVHLHLIGGENLMEDIHPQ
jgi:histidine triad (HIT) family protein